MAHDPVERASREAARDWAWNTSKRCWSRVRSPAIDRRRRDTVVEAPEGQRTGQPAVASGAEMGNYYILGSRDYQREAPRWLTMRAITSHPSSRWSAKTRMLALSGRSTEEGSTAKRWLVELAVTILRMLAGSEFASFDLMRKPGESIDAQRELHKLSGDWLSIEDEQKALGLPQSDFASTATDREFREWQRNWWYGAHSSGRAEVSRTSGLGREPHFGGKYSERLIKEGIASIERASKPPGHRSLSRKKKRRSGHLLRWPLPMTCSVVRSQAWSDETMVLPEF